MQLFLALLLLATIWTCEAFYLAKESNAGWEEDFEKYLLEAVDFDVASQDNSPHHTLASSPTTLHTSNSHHQVCIEIHLPGECRETWAPNSIKILLGSTTCTLIPACQ
jgi:hypothetical protein